MSGTLDEATTVNVVRVLNDINGVKKVNFITASASIDISFDDTLTSSQELRAALQREGFGLKKRAHGEEGMCCGSCGS